MKWKLLDEELGERTFALIFDKGDEVLAGLQKFAVEAELTAAHFTAIGAFEKVTLGFFDIKRKDYERIPIGEQVEVLSLVGNVSLEKEKPKIHAHVVVAKRDGTAHGGHLLEAYVRPTLEVMLVELPENLRRRPDAESGLALINL